MNAAAGKSSAKKLLILRVLLKLMVGVAVLVSAWIAFRFIFNFPTYDNRRAKTIPVQDLQVGDSLTTQWAGRELLVYKKSASQYLVVNQRSPEFSCLLKLIENGADKKKLLEDSCTGDVFDLDGVVLPGQRATRNLLPLPYEINSQGALLLAR